MKLRQSKFPLVIILTTAIGVSGQTLSKAELLTEFGFLPCEHVHAQTDSIAEEIKQDATSKLAVLISPPTNRPEQAQRLRRQISSFLQNRGLSTDRFSFYKGSKSPAGEIRTHFWKLEPGDTLPFADAAPWPEEVPDTSRPFIFGHMDEIAICPMFVPRAFAKLIMENPGSRGHVVVQAGNDAMIDRFWFAEQLIKELVESQRVPRNRLRLFFMKGNRDSTTAEFWFVPAKLRSRD